ncbi:hypothetical protein FRC05_000615 [Tulasnella sp. 425]|nr:hypothetical protein FRC05_000615 [Tulasnella sp. 425]
MSQPPCAHCACCGGKPAKRQRICPSSILGSLNIFRIEKIRITPFGADSSKKLQGRSADVEPAYLGTDCGRVKEYFNSTEPLCVAVKKLRLDYDTVDDWVLAPLAHELSLLSKLSHSNIVKLVGFVEDAKEGVAWMILPWESNGNLREYVQSMDLKIPERVSLIFGVAQGIQYLHSRKPPICHGDLKSLNVLVNSANRAIITDFGSARPLGCVFALREGFETVQEHRQGTLDQEQVSVQTEVSQSGTFITLTGPKWTLRWAAPELLNGGLPSLASDIWAFGWICWEAITGKLPFPEANEVTVVLQVVEGQLPQLGDHNDLNQIHDLCSLMRDCWMLDPSKRPPARKCAVDISWMTRVTPSTPTIHGVSRPASAALLRARGWMNLKNGYTDNALHHFNQALDVAQSTGDQMGIVNAVEALAEVYYMMSDLPMAKAWYSRAQNMCIQSGETLGLANVFKGLGDVYASENEYAMAETLYSSAYNLYASLPNHQGIGNVIIGRAKICHMQDMHTRSRSLYMEAVTIFAGIGTQFGIATAKKGLGLTHYMMDEYSEAEADYIEARNIFIRIGDYLGVAQASQGLGDVYCASRQYSDAQAMYTYSHKVYLHFKDQRSAVHAALGQANVCFKTGLYSEAEATYEHLHRLSAQIDYAMGKAHALKGLGDVYSTRRQHSRAEESYLRARDIYARCADQLCLGNVAKRLANIYYMQGQYSNAENLYINARVLYSKVGDQHGLASVIHGLANVYYMNDEYSKARDSYILACIIYRRIRVRHGLESAIEGLESIDQSFLFDAVCPEC